MLTYVGKSKFRNQKNTYKITIILNASPTALLTYQLKTKYVAPTSFAHHFFVENIIIFISPNYTWPYITHDVIMKGKWEWAKLILLSCQVTTDHFTMSHLHKSLFFPFHMFCLITCDKFIMKLNETTNCAVSFT